jgi:hypothetical protein
MESHELSIRPSAAFYEGMEILPASAVGGRVIIREEKAGCDIVSHCATSTARRHDRRGQDLEAAKSDLPGAYIPASSQNYTGTDRSAAYY